MLVRAIRRWLDSRKPRIAPYFIWYTSTEREDDSLKPAEMRLVDAIDREHLYGVTSVLEQKSWSELSHVEVLRSYVLRLALMSCRDGHAFIPRLRVIPFRRSCHNVAVATAFPGNVAVVTYYRRENVPEVTVQNRHGYRQIVLAKYLSDRDVAGVIAAITDVRPEDCCLGGRRA